jgi:hypothetical protein
MPVYVYGCGAPDHEREEVVHGFHDNPEIVCKTCGEAAHRIPQPLRAWYRNPGEVLLEYMDNKYIEWRKKQHANKQRA